MRPHVAVRQLEPGPGEGISELLRMIEVAPGNLLVDRIEPQREIGGEHRGLVALGGIVRVGNSARASVTLGLPLVRAGRTLGQFPFVAEQVVEKVVAPLGWRCASR